MVDSKAEEYISCKDGAEVISTMDLCDVRNLVQDRDKKCYGRWLSIEELAERYNPMAESFMRNI